MDVIASKNPSSLKIKYECGTDDDGNVIKKSKTYQNLKPHAQNLDVYEVAKAISNLCDYKLSEIYKVDTTTLSE
jgi:hypothetical protein